MDAKSSPSWAPARMCTPDHSLRAPLQRSAARLSVSETDGLGGWHGRPRRWVESKIEEFVFAFQDGRDEFVHIVHPGAKAGHAPPKFISVMRVASSRQRETQALRHRDRECILLGGAMAVEALHRVDVRKDWQPRSFVRVRGAQIGRVVVLRCGPEEIPEGMRRHQQGTVPFSRDPEILRVTAVSCKRFQSESQDVPQRRGKFPPTEYDEFLLPLRRFSFHEAPVAEVLRNANRVEPGRGCRELRRPERCVSRTSRGVDMKVGDEACVGARQLIGPGKRARAFPQTPSGPPWRLPTGGGLTGWPARAAAHRRAAGAGCGSPIP